MSGPVNTALPISVEELVRWTYAVQKADVMLADRAMMSQANVGSQLEQILALGTRVDTSGIGAALAFSEGVHVAEDAVTVHEVCTAYLPRDQADLVMMHGRLRSRPDPRIGARWRMEPREWRYEEVPEGSGSWLRVAVAEYLNRHQSWYVPVIERDKPGGVARDRAAWALWREGLATVLAVAGPRLIKHRLTDVFPDSAPWLKSEAEKAGV